MLYPGTTKPLYQQLKNILKDSITKGDYKVGEALPGERQLMDVYGVSRVTVRQAIIELINEGLLFRQHGKGTFVMAKRIQRPLAQLLGVAEELALIGLNIKIDVLSTQFETPSPEISDKLQLPKGELVFCVARLILANDQPILLDYSYFPQTIGRLLQNVNLSNDLIYSQLELYGYHISNGEQSILASLTTKEEAKYLKCKIGSPTLVINRITYVEGDLPIDFTRATYRGDRYEYHVNLQRNIIKSEG